MDNDTEHRVSIVFFHFFALIPALKCARHFGAFEALDLVARFDVVVLLDCNTAIPLTCNTDPETYSSVGSTALNTTGCGVGGHGLWFAFTGTGDDIIFKSIASFDHEISMNNHKH